MCVYMHAYEEDRGRYEECIMVCMKDIQKDACACVCVCIKARGEISASYESTW